MSEATPTQRAALTAGLRALADFLDTHPEIPVCPHGAEIIFFPGGDDATARAEIDRIAAALDVTPTGSRGGHYTAARAFGPIAYRAVAIPAAEMAAHEAVSSYAGAVIP